MPDDPFPDQGQKGKIGQRGIQESGIVTTAPDAHFENVGDFKLP
jgi:hypothetical protein